MIANPMTLLESRYLIRHHAISWRWRLMLLLCILPIATIPFHTYITTENVQWLYLMMAVTFGLQVWLWVRTVWLAARPLPRLNEDLLILTGIEGGHSVQSRWWAVVRHLWPDYLLVVVARFGVALGLVQIMHSHREIWSLPKEWFSFWHPLYLASQPAFDYASLYGLPELANPGQIVLALICLLLVLICQLGLLNGLATLLMIHIRQRKMIFAVILLSYAVITLGVLFGFGLLREAKWDYRMFSFCSFKLPEVVRQILPKNTCVEKETVLRISETIEVSVSTWVDQGSVLAANVMRPFSLSRSQWPFVFRNIVSAVIAIVGYAGLTWVLLWAAGRASRRRGYL